MLLGTFADAANGLARLLGRRGWLGFLAAEGVTLTSGRDYLTADGHDTNSHVMADTLMQRVMGATDGERLTRTQLLEHSQYPRDW